MVGSRRSCQASRSVLGVDFGNVIIDHLGFATTQEFVAQGDYTQIPPVPAALDSLRLLRASDVFHSILIVYNATDVADTKITAWLAKHSFQETTGIRRSLVLRSPQGRDKGRICQDYGVTHFVDDRLEVLIELSAHVPNLYLFRPQAREVAQFQQAAPRHKRLVCWSDLLQCLLDDSAAAPGQNHA